MVTLRALLLCLPGCLLACRPAIHPGDKDDPRSQDAQAKSRTSEATKDLTARERQDFLRALEKLPSPCVDAPKETLGACAEHTRRCPACEIGSAFVAKAIRDGRSNAQVQAAYRIRFAPELVKTISVGDSPAIGPQDAPITVVEFADFECPFCSMVVPILDQVVHDYAPSVRVVFKHFPLTSHKHAELAARAAVAAGNQGKFWEMHHRIFDNQSQLDRPRLETLAKALNLDSKRFNDDIDASETAKRVAKDHAQGSDAGIKGTPAIFINGRSFDFALFDFASGDFVDWIRQEIELHPKPTSSTSAPPTSAPPSASSGAIPTPLPKGP